MKVVFQPSERNRKPCSRLIRILWDPSVGPSICGSRPPFSKENKLVFWKCFLQKCPRFKLDSPWVLNLRKPILLKRKKKQQKTKTNHWIAVWKSAKSIDCNLCATRCQLPVLHLQLATLINQYLPQGPSWFHLKDKINPRRCSFLITPQRKWLWLLKELSGLKVNFPKVTRQIHLTLRWGGEIKPSIQTSS